MRPHSLIAALAAASVACHEAPTDPFSHVSEAPPSGLPVTLGITPRTTATLFQGPVISGEGDSLSTSAEFDVSGCLDYTVAAGLAQHLLVVTITERSAPGRFCNLPKMTAVFRAVVRPAPRGVYQVVLRRRLEFTDGPREQELARGSASLP